MISGGGGGGGRQVVPRPRVARHVRPLRRRRRRRRAGPRAVGRRPGRLRAAMGRGPGGRGRIKTRRDVIE